MLSGYPRTLQWSNFGNRNTSPNPPFSAQTSSRYRVSWASASLQNGVYRLRNVVVRVQLVTGQTWKDLSWYNNASATEKTRLLEHEQGHYEITGLVGRDLEEALTGLEMSDDVVSVLRGVGDSASARLQYARRELHAQANEKVTEANNLYQWLENANIGGTLREGQYERDTNHGQNRNAQQRWTDTFRAARVNDIPLSLLLTMHGCDSGMATGGTCHSNAAP